MCIRDSPDAVYAREYTFDLSKVRPVVAKPDFVDNVVPAEETCGIPINEAFLGSCNNGRIEDVYKRQVYTERQIYLTLADLSQLQVLPEISRLLYSDRPVSMQEKQKIHMEQAVFFL